MLRLSLLFIVTGTAASAHVGHPGDFGGHDHWVAGGALGLAGLVAVRGLAKRKRGAPRGEEPEPQQDEAEA